MSRIRSMKIDSWKETDLMVFESVGNRLANGYYEARLNNKSLKPHQDANIEDKIIFVRTKYLDKRFVRDPAILSPA